jgi:hypothetical protein
MHGIITSVLLTLQEGGGASENSSPVLSVSLMVIVIGIIMVCLLILGVLSLGDRTSRRNRTRT